MILPVYKDRIPYRFDTEIQGEVFTFEIHYNGDYDFFTFDLLKNEQIIILGEKIVYGRPLFESLSDIRLPKSIITPLDPSGEENEITYDNFTETVKLFVEEVA
ncbi:hypothetical protein G4V62_13775 [Bacillaceae bacterium SIJ1]|uniref:phage baseplate plug family protein n=1 Tax=Litoribacterium kuwaitense TaxID=1398745 RepID=UPI0013EA2C8F|nr:hypothetical protein [Litoribacterium kuwaitense]NGP45963.1 hypothetical protein [Litoribacterium kuwaitense]